MRTFESFLITILGAVSVEALLFRFGNTIWSWILDEYNQRKIHLYEKVLTDLASVVHISFNLWTAPNNTAYIDIVCHFLDTNKKLRCLLYKLSVCLTCTKITKIVKLLVSNSFFFIKYFFSIYNSNTASRRHQQWITTPRKCEFSGRLPSHNQTSYLTPW